MEANTSPFKVRLQQKSSNLFFEGIEEKYIGDFFAVFLFVWVFLEVELSNGIPRQDSYKFQSLLFASTFIGNQTGLH